MEPIPYVGATRDIEQEHRARRVQGLALKLPSLSAESRHEVPSLLFTCGPFLTAALAIVLTGGSRVAFGLLTRCTSYSKVLRIPAGPLQSMGGWGSRSGQGAPGGLD